MKRSSVRSNMRVMKRMKLKNKNPTTSESTSSLRIYRWRIFIAVSYYFFSELTRGARSDRLPKTALAGSSDTPEKSLGRFWLNGG